MKIINVIEYADGDLLSVNSYPIVNEQLDKGKQVEKAEKQFKQCAISNGCPEEQVESYLDDGYFGIRNEYRLYLTWSFVNE